MKAFLELINLVEKVESSELSQKMEHLICEMHRESLGKQPSQTYGFDLEVVDQDRLNSWSEKRISFVKNLRMHLGFSLETGRDIMMAFFNTPIPARTVSTPSLRFKVDSAESVETLLRLQTKLITELGIALKLR